MPVSARMIELDRSAAGPRLLELAAGPGDTGFLAAELIKPGGELICSDFAPEMLTVAQDARRALGLDNVRFKQIDAESIDIEAGDPRRRPVPLGLHADGRPRERRCARPGASCARAAGSRSPPGPTPEHNLDGRAARAELAERGAARAVRARRAGPVRLARPRASSRTCSATRASSRTCRRAGRLELRVRGLRRLLVESTLALSQRARAAIGELDEPHAGSCATPRAPRRGRHRGRRLDQSFRRAPGSPATA